MTSSDEIEHGSSVSAPPSSRAAVTRSAIRATLLYLNHKVLQVCSLLHKADLGVAEERDRTSRVSSVSA